MAHATYENPLTHRYASTAMSKNWSPDKKFRTWRTLWIALAELEQELGVDISDNQIEELKAQRDNLNIERAQQIEEELRHDVMSHVEAFGEQCPNSKPIIHLGATSCFVTDNTELIQIRDSLQLIEEELIELLHALRSVCLEYKALPTLGFTHFQPAQLTTVGKRASLWLYDFALDLQDLRSLLKELPFRGAKGTTGTQASFLALFHDDQEKVKTLDARLAEKMGFSESVPVCGQTYTRKFDQKLSALLIGIAQSAAKMCTDIRLLQHLNEVEEPFGKKQVGSSAMAYKRNPIRSERVCSLARYAMSLFENTAETHANQWLERSLDDSANRRLSIPQLFLTVDAILLLSTKISSGLQVWPQVIERRVKQELPFMATENILMACTEEGGDRQTLHAAIREHSMAAREKMRTTGADNDLLTRITNDPLFASVHHRIDELTDPSAFIGRAPEQVDEFVTEHIDPLLDGHNVSKNQEV